MAAVIDPAAVPRIFFLLYFECCIGAGWRTKFIVLEKK